eukprot:TRINITY_DN4882_c0_g1_i1.p1 TRINITY_DN4882_c0_g1~~TRINITY_DN4882_c0_g1_i1.p1  ORF type:complete len:341 (+),score=135.24 TRINITY_DN4882_c0_g1_i1:561-1583(+)
MLTSQRSDAVSQIDHLIIEKRCMETEMFGKFVEILNEKKKKIRELKEEIKNRAFNQPLLSTLETRNDDINDEDDDRYLMQTGESQYQIQGLTNDTSLTFNNLSAPTPSFELLKDDGGDFQPKVRKRHRQGVNNNATDGEVTKKSPPKLISTGSHGIITLNADSPMVNKNSKTKSVTANLQETPPPQKNKKQHQQHQHDSNNTSPSTTMPPPSPLNLTPGTISKSTTKNHQSKNMTTDSPFKSKVDQKNQHRQQQHKSHSDDDNNNDGNDDDDEESLLAFHVNKKQKLNDGNVKKKMVSGLTKTSHHHHNKASNKIPQTSKPKKKIEDTENPDDLISQMEF